MSWRVFNKGDIDDGFQMPKAWGALARRIRRRRERRFWRRDWS